MSTAVRIRSMPGTDRRSAPLPPWVVREPGTSGADLQSDRLRELAAESGLVVAGVSDAAEMPELEGFLVRHIERGYLQGMDWFDSERARIASDPRNLHPTSQSVISVGVPFYQEIEQPADGVLRGRIARYAWGIDYHRTLKGRMVALHQLLERELGRSIEARHLVDTARTSDRVWAARAGTGWYGKHSCIIVPGAGSWVMLGEFFVDVSIEPDQPLQRSCGSCSICLDRCPTGAIVAPYTVDSPRCISFQTIEQRGLIPVELRARMGNWVFGCDICQDVCPYTKAAAAVVDPDFAPRSIDHAFPSLVWLLEMTEEAFRERYRGTAVLRAKRLGLARNAAIALGNSGDRGQIAPLSAAMQFHDEPLVRGHAAWAIGHLGGGEARAELEKAHHHDPDDYVQSELRAALAMISADGS